MFIKLHGFRVCSRNGTFVNDVKVGKGNCMPIKNGDEITLSKLESEGTTGHFAHALVCSVCV